MFLSLPVLERLAVLRQLKACLDGSGSNQLPSLDDLAASFLEQRQQGTQPSPSEERIRVLEAPEAPPLAAERRLVDGLIRTVILDEQDDQAMLRASAAGVLDLQLPAGSAGGSSCVALPATHR
jgi:hypothetical protein